MKKILVLVDYQNDFVSGALGSPNALAIKDKVEAKIEEYSKNNDKIIFTMDSHDECYEITREGRNLPIKHCIAGTDGELLSIDLTKLSCLSNKTSFLYKVDRFGLEPSQLEDMYNYLYNNDDDIEPPYDEIEFTIIGVATNICVLSVAVSLQNTFNNSDIYIDAECCASYDSELHEKALDVMEGLQFKVINRKK